MNSFYNIIDKIKQVVTAEPFNNEITFGDIADIDLKKQSLFPLAHIMVNNMNIEEQHVTFNITLFLMDLVDISNEPDTTLFLGNDNRQDILNTQAALATRVIRVLQKSDLYKDEFQLIGTASCEPFTERFDNMLAGWAVTFDVGAKDEMTYC
jgi:hypothetical protein|tara:strand:+ start:70 stop:525 length:456 start_codon:yes stop_codon:yes gene_type:complete